MPSPFVADHSFLRAFLVTREVPLARRVLDSPLHVPPAIYDPANDDDRPQPQRSEVRRGLDHWRNRLAEANPGSAAYAHAEYMVESFEQIVSLESAGDVVPVELTHPELVRLGQLTDRDWLRSRGFRGWIHSGEAMSLAVALEREWGLAADDNDALQLLEILSPGHPTMRVRRCLLMAVERDLISCQEARSLHAEMKRLGFWDRGEIECE